MPITVSPAPVITAITEADGNHPVLQAGVPGILRIYGQNFGTTADIIQRLPGGYDDVSAECEWGLCVACVIAGLERLQRHNPIHALREYS